MIAFIKKLWNKWVAAGEEYIKQEEEKQQMLRENLEAWDELNKDFIKELHREIDKEIDDFCDVSKIPKPDAYNFDGSPLSR